MKWTWKLGTVGGTEVRVHATFFLLILWLVLSYGFAGQGVGEIAYRVLFVVVLFGCVVLHELGHALAARRYGIGTRDITLLPIGGLARLERIPREPFQELVVALAGPAVNVVIAVTLAAALGLLGAPLPEFDLEALGARSFAWNLVLVNVFLVVFNALPAFPMDGGRVLRALLAMRTDYLRATRIAATVGQVMAFAFAFVGLLANPFLILIALFVWIGAAYEANLVGLQTALQGVPVRQAMLRKFHTLERGEPLTRAVDLTLEGSQKDFPVLDSRAVVGLLTQSDLLAGLAEHGRSATVGEVMRSEVPALASEEPLDGALERFERAGSGTLPVVDDGALVGLLTLDNVSEFMKIRSALDGERDAPGMALPRSPGG